MDTLERSALRDTTKEGDEETGFGSAQERHGSRSEDGSPQASRNGELGCKWLDDRKSFLANDVYRSQRRTTTTLQRPFDP